MNTIVANHNPNLVLIKIWTWGHYFDMGEICDFDIEKLPIAAWVISHRNLDNDDDSYNSTPVPGEPEYGSDEDFIILDTQTGWWSHPYVSNGYGEESLRRYLTEEAIANKEREKRREERLNATSNSQNPP